MPVKKSDLYVITKANDLRASFFLISCLLDYNLTGDF